MTNKKYTDQEIKELFPKQAKTVGDISDIALAIDCYGLEIAEKASKFEQAKTGKNIRYIANTIDYLEDIYRITNAINGSALKVIEQALEFEQAKTGDDIRNIAVAIDCYGLEMTEQAAKDEKAKTGRDIKQKLEEIFII